MTTFPEGNAIIYCDKAFGTLNGKTAHGLVRKTNRYRVLAVVDSRHEGKDAGLLLDGRHRGIPVHGCILEAFEAFEKSGTPATYMVIGLAPDGGRISAGCRDEVIKAIKMGLHVDSGLHDFLSEDDEISGLAATEGVRIRDIRKPPHRKDLHFFSGKIEQVASLKVAVLGTDSAIGKRTTAWILRDALETAGYSAELIGTGQTSWMQGVRYGIILDSLINDFVSGEIEHVVWKAWEKSRPQVILIEGQGSLMNPAYPGGFEIMAAGRPDLVIFQHAPARREYDGFPGYPIHPLDTQIRAIELLSGKPVVAITINHEKLGKDKISRICAETAEATGLPVYDVLFHGPGRVVDAITASMRENSKR